MRPRCCLLLCPSVGSRPSRPASQTEPIVGPTATASIPQMGENHHQLSPGSIVHRPRGCMRGGGWAAAARLMGEAGAGVCAARLARRAVAVRQARVVGRLTRRAARLEAVGNLNSNTCDPYPRPARAARLEAFGAPRAEEQ